MHCGRFHGWDCNLLVVAVPLPSTVALLLFIIVEQIHAKFSTAAHVDHHNCHSASVALMLLFWNLSTHLYTLHFSKPPITQFAEIVQWISAPGTPSDYKIQITAHCSSLWHTATLQHHYNNTTDYSRSELQRGN